MCESAESALSSGAAVAFLDVASRRTGVHFYSRLPPFGRDVGAFVSSDWPLDVRPRPSVAFRYTLLLLMCAGAGSA